MDRQPNDVGQRPASDAAAPPQHENCRFLERFGRNLDLGLVERAGSAIHRRIAGSLAHHQLDRQKPARPPSNPRGLRSLGKDDVHIFPAGMNAIFNAHRALSARGRLRSICFGLPYVDTLKMLQKFGPGCLFYSNVSSDELNDLEGLLRSGHTFLVLFCEFPGNPLLISPDLDRIRKLANEFDFAVVETIGTFANVNVVPVADIVVSSLTKIFSGDSNVMGGSAILNPESGYYGSLKKAMDHDVYQDTYWSKDVVFMERNSRDFLARVDRINVNAEAICHVLRGHPLIKSLYYPKYNPSKHHYDACRLPNGGYGGLLSVVFNRREQAQAFYDAVDIAKGLSLGTNFTVFPLCPAGALPRAPVGGAVWRRRRPHSCQRRARGSRRAPRHVPQGPAGRRGGYPLTLSPGSFVGVYPRSVLVASFGV